MNCDEFLHILSSYIDGELDGENAESVQEHAAECLSCRRALDRMRKCTALIGGIPEADPIIPAPAAILPSTEKSENRLGLVLRPVLAAGVIFILLFSGVSIDQDDRADTAGKTSLTANATPLKAITKITRHRIPLTRSVVLGKSRYHIAVKGKNVELLQVRAWEHSDKKADFEQ